MVGFSKLLCDVHSGQNLRYKVEDRVQQVFGVKVRLPANTDQLRAGMAADVYFPNLPAQP